MLRKGHSLAVLAICASAVTAFTVIASAQEDYNIPQWVKNTAGWWAEDAVGDSDFINSMQWLIENKILQVSTTEDDEWRTEADKLYKENQQLKQDIKVLENDVSILFDENLEYYRIIQEQEKKYLTKEFRFSMEQPDNWERQKIYLDPFEGIPIYEMVESSTLQESQPTTINVIIDDLRGLSLEEYREAEWNQYYPLLSAFGEVEVVDATYDTIDGQEAISDLYTYYVKLEPSIFNPVAINAKLKIESIIVAYRGDAYTISYLATEENFDEHWWQFGEILKTFKFLSTGISVEDTTYYEQTPQKQSTSTTSTQYCSGSARCISGIVTRVVDGDTIHVDGQSIRFALASTPELNEYRGLEAKQFVEQICPVGSEALVDEDDGQTQGSYGRIIAVIYCNGVNLNEEILESPYGEISKYFCSESEFSNEPWAQKHGCGTKTQEDISPEIKTEPTQPKENNCDPSYPTVCIPPYPPDLDCGEIQYRDFKVLPPDPHRFDGDKDGIGCES